VFIFFQISKLFYEFLSQHLIMNIYHRYIFALVFTWLFYFKYYDYYWSLIWFDLGSISIT